MKKRILLATAMFLSSISFAQIQKGAVSLGGSIGVSTRSDKNTNLSSSGLNDVAKKSKELSFYINPQVGYFISDKIVLGVYGEFDYTTENTDLPYFDNYGRPRSMKGKRMNSAWGSGVFAKYYFTLGEKAYFGLESNVGYSTFKSASQRVDYREDNMGEYKYFLSDYYAGKSSYVNVGFRPSLLLFPAKHWGLDFSLGNIVGFSTGKNEYEFNDPTGTVENPTTETDKDIRTFRNVEFGLSSMNPSIGVFYYFNN